MEAVKKPQHFKQVMGITTALLICAHSKTSGFTCYSNDKTWLHRCGKDMSAATVEHQHKKNNQTQFDYLLHRTYNMCMSMMQEWRNQIDFCPVMDDLLWATVCCMYVQVERAQKWDRSVWYLPSEHNTTWQLRQDFGNAVREILPFRNLNPHLQRTSNKE